VPTQIEAAQTSPLESLYERVLRLEQEVSALKRNLPMGSADHERVDWGQPFEFAVLPDSICRKRLGIRAAWAAIQKRAARSATNGADRYVIVAG